MLPSGSNRSDQACYRQVRVTKFAFSLVTKRSVSGHRAQLVSLEHLYTVQPAAAEASPYVEAERLVWVEQGLRVNARVETVLCAMHLSC